MKRVGRSEQSNRDAVELADYIAQNSYAASTRFLNAIEDTYKFLAGNPEAGQLCRFKSSSAEGLRVWPVEKFRSLSYSFGRRTRALWWNACRMAREM